MSEAKDDDALMRGFMSLKSSLIGYEEEFGKEVAVNLVALASVMRDKLKEEGTPITRRECEAYLAEEYRAGRLTVNL